jgi:16S rRNA (guanine527-N7)-methyltransferase
MNLLWTQLASKANLALSDAQGSLFLRYLDLLDEANATMNLTRIVDRPSAEVQHIADSLMLLPLLPAGAIRLADVGSGGGVPGIPLAIARPEIQVTLIESTQKKAAFLQHAVATLGLANVRVIPRRAEDVAAGPERETFDVAVARAVGALNLLVEWCLPLVKKGGKLLAMKGERIAEELPPATRPIFLLSGGPAVVHPAGLPGAEHHVIVEVPKLGRTPPRYPRPASIAKHKPIA